MDSREGGRMKTEDKVTSLELSEKLKAAGAVQESESFWCVGGMSFKPFIAGRAGGPFDDRYSAYDCPELLEMLSKIRLVALHTSEAGSTARLVNFSPSFEEDTAAEALGKLLLWCIENGHVEKGA